MSLTLLNTKLFIPPLRPKAVPRPRLLERLEEGLSRKLTLICAPAGFGKTTLVSAWMLNCRLPNAWLSLDAADGDSTHFLRYLIAALQTISTQIGAGVSQMLQSANPPALESVLTVLINEISMLPSHFVLVLDDYHRLASKPTLEAMTFLLDHLPPQMHLVITTREEPALPLARLRSRGELTELRHAELRFSLDEASHFLNQTMNLQLSSLNIAALETRTEGWIAGLQLAAISLRGHSNPTQFIESFRGSNRFVQDYLLEEVLRQQPASVQHFLLATSILERFCGSLCDAILEGSGGQNTLESLEQANLFIIPLDNERKWYRYHHLFAELLQKRLQNYEYNEYNNKQSSAAQYHIRASEWYEASGLELEAFDQAGLANDLERAIRLIEGNGMPLYYRGFMAPIIRWLEVQPKHALNNHAVLWVIFGWSLMLSGRPSQVEAKLQAAELALLNFHHNNQYNNQHNNQQDAITQDLLGQIATLRALVATAHNQTEAIFLFANRALELLHPQNQPARTALNLTLGYAYQAQGNRLAASQAFADGIAAGRASGNVMFTVAALGGLGAIQEAENQLGLAAQTYQDIVQMIADPTHMVTCEAHMGLARIFYQWNELDTAELHLQASAKLAVQLECDTALAAVVLQGKLRLARGELEGATHILAQASETAQVHQLAHRILEIVAVQVALLLRRGRVREAEQMAQLHPLPLVQARVLLAQNNAAAALVLFEGISDTPPNQHPNQHPNPQLEGLLVTALALEGIGDLDGALRVLDQALAGAEAGGFIRIFMDEGQPMARLLARAHSPAHTNYLAKVREACEKEFEGIPPLSEISAPALQTTHPVFDPLSKRELEVLHLIIEGLSNQEISDRLVRSLSTIKWHNQKIFDKLQVQRRTEAVARARELKLFQS